MAQVGGEEDGDHGTYPGGDYFASAAAAAGDNHMQMEGEGEGGEEDDALPDFANMSTAELSAHVEVRG